MKRWQSVRVWRVARRLIAPGLLLFTAFAAWMLSSGRQTWWLAIIRDLAEYEVFHVIAHFCIFAAVGLLLGPLGRGVPWWGGWVFWGFVLTGTVLIESAQVIALRLPINRSSVGSAFYDLVVNSLGAGSGLALWLLITFRRIRTSSANSQSNSQSRGEPS